MWPASRRDINMLMWIIVSLVSCAWRGRNLAGRSDGLLIHLSFTSLRPLIIAVIDNPGSDEGAAGEGLRELVAEHAEHDG